MSRLFASTSALSFFLVGLMLPVSFSHAQSLQPNTDLVNSAVVDDLRKFLETDIVRLSVENQNTKYQKLEQAKIDQLDGEWRTETKSDDQPLISATMSSPLSSYLTRMQADSKGLYTALFVMDQNGLNVGQSAITSDYWQGDEPKFQKTFPVGPKAVFIDDPEFDKDLGIWVVQANITVSDDARQKSIGSATVDINLTELARRKGATIF